MMGATDIQTCVDVGHVVQLDRAGRRWLLPAEVRYRKGEYASWVLYDALMLGDHLTLPDSDHQVVVLGVVLASEPHWRGALYLHVAFLTVADCPACGTRGSHPIDVPTDLTLLRRYVIHTCITCDHSWQADAQC